MSHKFLLSDNLRNAHFTGFFQRCQKGHFLRFSIEQTFDFEQKWVTASTLPLFLTRKLGFAPTWNKTRTSVRHKRTVVRWKSNRKEHSFDKTGTKNRLQGSKRMDICRIFVPERMFLAKKFVFCQSGDWVFFDP